MKRLFGHPKPKPTKGTGPSSYSQEDPNIPTPIHQQHAVYLHQQSHPSPQSSLANPPSRSLRRTSSEEERWEVVSGHDDAQMRTQYPAPSSQSHNSSFASLPPGASPPIPSPNGARSPSPFSINSNKGPQVRDREPPQQQQAALRKKQPQTVPAALRILGSLDPPTAAHIPTRTNSEERFMNVTSYSDTGHREREKDPPERKEKRGFWSRGDKDKDKDREREREREARERGRMLDSRDHGREKERRDSEGAELTRMIGFLTATASEDWGLVMEVCERASASENNAKEAVRALRREFKYGEPAAQLSAARLWAIMLRNSSELFISHSTARKFLDTLEDLLNSSRTSPVVRERVLDVIAAAAYASGSKRDTGFRGLWRRVKPVDKPDEGMPLDNDDAMFNPPVSSRGSHFETIPGIEYQEPSPLPADLSPTTPQPNPPRKHESRNRIIPPDEDIRRLFQECKIGQGNASLLSQALALSRPEDLKKKDIIKEFYLKCRASQELIFAQIPWASAGAEQSRVQRDQEALAHGMPEEQRLEQTTKEKLLAALLTANAELVDALQQYDDLERVAMERKAEEVSRKETKMDRRHIQQYQQDGEFHSDPSLAAGGAGGSSSPSPSRSPSPLLAPHAHLHHPHPHSGTEIGSLAPPPPAPHGPRLPAQINTYAHTHSRTPSPATPILENLGASGASGFELQNGMNNLRIRHDAPISMSMNARSSTYDEYTPIKPSAKALGKRRAAEDDPPENFGEEDFYGEADTTFSVEDPVNSDDDEGWPQHRPAPFVYDAAAERTQQRIREGHALVVNGVH
ncbi:hypothetical protein FPV67DRAFT_1629149 [Lyophyllum atratum]|nr:hypothetical protein FPV67DRAFT_1629149 [Lyophyllum atratum]